MIAQALEDIWAITPDPRRDRLAAGFVTHAVALATGVSPAEIASAGRTSKAAARARQIAVYPNVKQVGIFGTGEVLVYALSLCLHSFFDEEAGTNWSVCRAST